MFPPGFEVTDLNDPTSPPRLWGFGHGSTVDPPQCASLADPIANPSDAHGLAGSGAGGIVYAVVSASPSPLSLDGPLVAQCARWSMRSGRTTATVELTDAPTIRKADTIGMNTATRTVVEGGTQAESNAVTMTAYLGDFVAFVSVVTDPGSPHPRLPPRYAYTLLVQTVVTLRGCCA